MGVPLYRWMVEKMEHPIKMNALEVPLFQEPPTLWSTTRGFWTLRCDRRTPSYHPKTVRFNRKTTGLGVLRNISMFVGQGFWMIWMWICWWNFLASYNILQNMWATAGKVQGECMWMLTTSKLYINMSSEFWVIFAPFKQQQTYSNSNNHKMDLFEHSVP